MSESLVVCLKIIAMFLVMGVGYFARRKAVVDARTTSVLARFVTDFTLPALIFTYLVETVDLASLKVGWTIPLLATAGACLGFVGGWASWRSFAVRSQAPVFIFSSGMSNWVYLPLPIVTAIYGKEGLQTLFLCNVGMQVLFWTLGVAILHGGHLDRKAINHVVTNPGMIATFIGIAFAIVRGLSGDSFTIAASHQPITSLVDIIADSLKLLGQATVPVSLIITGAQIASATMVQNRPAKALAGIIFNRLLLAPLLCIGMLWAFNAMWPILTPPQLMVIAIVLLMPVSVTSPVLAEKMNQDVALAAQAVLYTTLASIATVPLVFSLAKAIL